MASGGAMEAEVLMLSISSYRYLSVQFRLKAIPPMLQSHGSTYAGWWLLDTALCIVIHGRHIKCVGHSQVEVGAG